MIVFYIDSSLSLALVSWFPAVFRVVWVFTNMREDEKKAVVVKKYIKKPVSRMVWRKGVSVIQRHLFV